MKLIPKLNSKGSVLVAAVVFGLVGFSIVISFFSWTINRRYALNHRIAKTKAMYNAETGLAEKAFSLMVRADFTGTDTTLVPGGVWIDNKAPEFSEGMYKKVQIKQEIDSVTSQIVVRGKALGIAYIKNQFGNLVPVEDSARISFVEESLAKYMYLTANEESGGAPFVFDSPGNRRHVTFGAGDILSGGNIQSNSSLVMSAFGCPQFLGTVFITIDPLTGETLDPQMGSCNPNQVFLGEPPTLERPPVKLPPDGYALAKNAADYVFDSTELFKHDFNHRDTLIMTDIGFMANGQFRVRRWWYLIPPHLNELAALPGGEYPFPTPYMMDGVTNPSAECGPPPINDLRKCVPYIQDMANYYAKTVTNGVDGYMNPTILGQHGFSHFDFPPTPDNLLQDELKTPNGPKVIYVKGGPVLVHGIYKGRFTVVTDEFVTYRRHAWNMNVNAPTDTLWGNIWITDDLRNSDASLGNMTPPQPDDKCEGGTENRMGLVSGANVIVANTSANGAANSGAGVVIHAAIVAFNESFTVHYWQNTTINEFDPPHGDNRGPSIFGMNTGQNDSRGTINLWGGLIQKYRGYIIRNNPSPYNNATIGYAKDYHYDENNACSPPPYFPTIQFTNNEKHVKLVDYGPIGG